MQIKAEGQYDPEKKALKVALEIVPNTPREHDLLKPLLSESSNWAWTFKPEGNVFKGELEVAGSAVEPVEPEPKTAKKAETKADTKTDTKK